MKFLTLAVVILVALSTSVFAVNTSNVPEAKGPASQPVGAPDGRVGGETMATAVTIPSLPYTDGGSTCGHVNDYDVACPYTGSTSPDVVYKYTTAVETNITVDLCTSTYDTKVYIFQDAAYNTIACNDDAGCGYSGWQSKLDHITLPGGHTYYIIVDGYGGGCGNYTMTVTENPPCVLECPPGALIESEPDCYDNFVDVWNGGCNSSPYVFENIPPAAPPLTVTLCGTSGTYLYYGSSYRDTDWFQLNVPAGPAQTITAACTAEFPLQFIFIYVADCNNLQYLITTAGICEEAALTYTVAGGGTAWIWVGASVFSGIPCGSDYILTLDGYYGTSPVEDTTWGSIKALYR